MKLLQLDDPAIQNAQVPGKVVVTMQYEFVLSMVAKHSKGTSNSEIAEACWCVVIDFLLINYYFLSTESVFQRATG